MQIVIEISEERFNTLKAGFVQHGSIAEKMIIEAVKKGTPLPKGHGRLIDEKDLSLTTVHLIDGVFVCTAPTIIPADKEEGE